jgi:hypothetical protein
MGRRLLFFMGLIFASYGGWMVHHESRINASCNTALANNSRGLAVSSQCLNIVWPYCEGFVLLVAGALFVFGGLLWTRRIMAGEHQYLKDLKNGKYSRENDHLNSYNFNIKLPSIKIGAGARGGLFDARHDEYDT